MMKSTQLTVRDAVKADLPALVAIKGEGSEGLHEDRLREAETPGYRYLVLLSGLDLIGFVCLIYRRLASVSEADDTQHLPKIVDLEIAEDHRGQGNGTFFIGCLQRIAAEAGFHQLFLKVEPDANPRAYALYQRLGFRQLQAEPYLESWKFTDHRGKIHQGEDWVVDMVIEVGSK